MHHYFTHYRNNKIKTTYFFHKASTYLALYKKQSVEKEGGKNSTNFLLFFMKNVILSSSDRPFGQFWDYGNDNVSLSVTQVSKSNPHSKLELL